MQQLPRRIRKRQAEKTKQDERVLELAHLLREVRALQAQLADRWARVAVPVALRQARAARACLKGLVGPEIMLREALPEGTVDSVEPR